MSQIEGRNLITAFGTISKKAVRSSCNTDCRFTIQTHSASYGVYLSGFRQSGGYYTCTCSRSCSYINLINLIAIKTSTKMAKHAHKEVSLFALRLAGPKTFSPRSHNEVDLAQYLISQTKVRNMQKQGALNKFWTFNPRSYYNLNRSPYDPTSDEEILVSYRDLFDNIFFLGSLKNKCKISVQKN